MSKKIRLIVFLIFICIGNIYSVEQPQSAKKIFQNAQNAFDRALEMKGEDKKNLMLKAIGLYSSLMETGNFENGYLYYNIGNAYYEAGYKGKALVNYKRALRLITGLEELNSNLQQVQTELNLDAMNKSWWSTFKKDLFFWHYIINYQHRKLVFYISFILFWVVLSVMIYKKSIVINTLAIAFLFISVCFGSSYGASFYEIHFLKEGIIVSGKTEARKGPSLSYEVFYEQPLTEGVAFTLIEIQNDWYKIELENGDRCWVSSSALELI